MEAVDRLWKELLRINPESPARAVEDVVRQCLGLSLPWTSRLSGVAAALFQAGGPDTGVSVYGVVRPGSDLVLVAGAGMPGPLAVPWGAPIAGLAAQELSAQFAGDARAFSDYMGGWLGVAACLAVPIVRERRAYAVLEMRSHQSDRIGLIEAELAYAVGALAAAAWPGMATQDN